MDKWQAWLSKPVVVVKMVIEESRLLILLKGLSGVNQLVALLFHIGERCW